MCVVDFRFSVKDFCNSKPLFSIPNSMIYPVRRKLTPEWRFGGRWLDKSPGHTFLILPACVENIVTYMQVYFTLHTQKCGVGEKERYSKELFHIFPYIPRTLFIQPFPFLATSICLLSAVYLNVTLTCTWVLGVVQKLNVFTSVYFIHMCNIVYIQNYAICLHLYKLLYWTFHNIIKKECKLNMS